MRSQYAAQLQRLFPEAPPISYEKSKAARRLVLVPSRRGFVEAKPTKAEAVTEAEILDVPQGGMTIAPAVRLPAGGAPEFNT